RGTSWGPRTCVHDVRVAGIGGELPDRILFELAVDAMPVRAAILALEQTRFGAGEHSLGIAGIGQQTTHAIVEFQVLIDLYTTPGCAVIVTAQDGLAIGGYQ